MNKSFKDLGIEKPILDALENMGFENPTEVQQNAIPQALKKNDLIVIAKTGSGKTAVYGISMLQQIDPKLPGPQGLVLVPTRELAVQVNNDINRMSKYLPHKTTAVYGQHNINTESQELRKGVTIVAGTPGRVFDHINTGTLITRNIKFLVLDEADRMLDMVFLDQVQRIVATLPKNRNTMLFSATMPKEIMRLCSRHMKDPVTIEYESETKTVDSIEQLYYRVKHNEKNTQLNRLLLIEQPESCMIFCNTKHAVDKVSIFLSRKGYAVKALHGDIPQTTRMRTIKQFKQGNFHILVATDVAARGLHIDNLSLVINYDVPEKDAYIHRIGRTGRAGNEGRAISLVTVDDIMTIYEIEEHIGMLIEETELPSEEVFRERQAQAGEWLEKNKRKIETIQSNGSGKGSNKGSKKRSASKTKSRSRNTKSSSAATAAKESGTGASVGVGAKGPGASAGTGAKNSRYAGTQSRYEQTKRGQAKSTSQTEDQSARHSTAGKGKRMHAESKKTYDKKTYDNRSYDRKSSYTNKKSYDKSLPESRRPAPANRASGYMRKQSDITTNITKNTVNAANNAASSAANARANKQTAKKSLFRRLLDRITKK